MVALISNFIKPSIYRGFSDFYRNTSLQLFIAPKSIPISSGRCLLFHGASKSNLHDAFATPNSNHVRVGAGKPLDG